MHPSIPSILLMQPPASISGVAGRIAMVFPPLANTRPVMQNFVLADEESGQEVRVMLIGHPTLDETRHRGGYIEIEAVEADSLQYRPQKPHNNKPQPHKIEVKNTAKIVRLLRGDENHGPLSRQRSAPSSHPSPSVEKAAAPAHAASESAPASTARSGVPRTVAQNVWALGAVYRMCAESAAWALTVEGKGETTVERLNSATQTIFIQATRDGLHHQLEPGAFFRQHGPEIADRFFKEDLRPKTAVDKLLAAIPEGNRPRALEVLVATGKLKAGSSLSEISESDAELCLTSGFIQLLGLNAA